MKRRNGQPSVATHLTLIIVIVLSLVYFLIKLEECIK